MKKYLLILVAFLGLNSCIQEPDLEDNTNMGNFEALWKIMDARYCFFEYKNINWDSIHTVYKSKVRENVDKHDYFELMGKMLAELKDGHVNLYSDFNTSRYWKWFTDYPSNFNPDIIYGLKYLGTDYKSVAGLRYNIIHNGKIGYIYYEDFSSQFSDANMYNIFTCFKDCQALIIDVRNNGGGYLSMAERFASYFFEKETITGYISHKNGTGHNDFSVPEPIKTPSHPKLKWLRPVAVLSNRGSYSATNNFICRMKKAPYAIIVGDVSGGGAGLPLSSELPNGWMVRFSASPMFDADMNQTEFGIRPDVTAALSSADASTGNDSVIETAILQLLKNR